MKYVSECKLCCFIASKWRILTRCNILTHENLSPHLYLKHNCDIMVSTKISRPLHILTASVTHSITQPLLALSRPSQSLLVDSTTLSHILIYDILRSLQALSFLYNDLIFKANTFRPRKRFNLSLSIALHPGLPLFKTPPVSGA
jgi:hypothetical protein